MEKKKWVKHLPLFILELVILAAAACVLYVTLRATDKENGAVKDNLKEENIAVNEDVKEKIKETDETGDTGKYTGIINVAFFGVDARDGSLGKGNRSDTIMVCSVNMDTHEVKLISIYRDTYLNLGNDAYGKCNKSYALGGPEQAIGMINMNTDLYVTDYITVGFEGLMKAVDALGGIEIDVQESEINHLNNYQISMVGETSDGTTFTAEEGTDYIPVTTAGVQTLNGLQTTAYCRIRYVGDDFKRAERQRDVLTAMMEKAQKASLSELTEAMNAVLPSVRTSLDVSDFISMLGMVADFNVTVSDGFPFESMRNGGTIGTNGSCVVPTSLEDNVIKLHELLYDEKNYEPSKEVKEFSGIIEADTKDYLQY